MDPNGPCLFLFSDTAQFCLQQSPCLEQLETWQSQAQRVAEIEANIAQKEKARRGRHTGDAFQRSGALVP